MRETRTAKVHKSLIGRNGFYFCNRSGSLFGSPQPTRRESRAKKPSISPTRRRTETERARDGAPPGTDDRRADRRDRCDTPRDGHLRPDQRGARARARTTAPWPARAPAERKRARVQDHFEEGVCFRYGLLRGAGNTAYYLTSPADLVYEPGENLELDLNENHDTRRSLRAKRACVLLTVRDARGAELNREGVVAAARALNVPVVRLVRGRACDFRESAASVADIGAEGWVLQAPRVGRARRLRGGAVGRC